MIEERIEINGIPSIIWGEKSEKVFIHVHGKMSAKEYAESFAQIAEERGYQTVSFDLPEHGERKNEERRCDVKNGTEDLTKISDYVFDRWKNVSLYACSLGAFFSLHAYKDLAFEHCLFQSPIVDMEYLIERMFLWFGISAVELKEKREIPTPVDLMSWNYYCWVKAHPIEKWTIPTRILYGALDDMQSYEVINSFAERFGALLTVSDISKHPFMEPADAAIVEGWLKDSI